MPRRAHKRTLAYAAVARLFACHESWIRRLIGRQVANFDADLYRRIMASAPALEARRMARIEAELARINLRAAAKTSREEAPDARL